MKIPAHAECLFQYNNLTTKAAWPGTQSLGGRNTHAQQSHKNGLEPEFKILVLQSTATDLDILSAAEQWISLVAPGHPTEAMSPRVTEGAGGLALELNDLHAL